MSCMKDTWVWDIETYPNCFLFCAVYYNGKGLRVFEISDRKSEVNDLLDFLRNVKKNNHKMVGFNNIGFDYPVLHYLLEKSKSARMSNSEMKITAEEIYEKANKIIKSQDGDRWSNIIKDSDVILPQIDLYKIHHFDNKAKSTSLKMLEFNMKSDDIEDLPFPVGKILSDKEKDELIEYNKHDVLQTLKFYKESQEAVEFRVNLTKKYGFDCTNYNDTKIGKEYFINRLERIKPGTCYIKGPHGRKLRQTKRESIDIGKILFPYLSFKRDEFKAIQEWFKSQVITETKGVFSDLKEYQVGEVAKYCEMKVKRKKWKTTPSPEEIQKALDDLPLSWVEEVQLKSKKGAKSYWLCWNQVETMNIVVDGFRFDFGTGGIHGSVESSRVFGDEEFIIKDADVASMYPNLAISNRVYPEHLGATFCDIYEDVYNERKNYPKGSAENAVMKLALNGVYGDSNSQYSPFYDPQYTMAITINGQLTICMLADMLLDVEGLEIIQVNTDGITVRLPKTSLQQYEDVCTEWQKIVKLSLEFADYSAMFIRDVNNYIAVYTNGKVKRKGQYEYEGLGWHQNHSSLVIPKAAEFELTGKGKVEDFILNHDDKYDFLLRTKVPRSSRLVMVLSEGMETELQNICRYYICKNGGKLVKIMPPLAEDKEWRRIGIDASWNVSVCNNIDDFRWDVDYDYYIAEARKLVDLLVEEKENDVE